MIDVIAKKEKRRRSRKKKIRGKIREWQENIKLWAIAQSP